MPVISSNALVKVLDSYSCVGIVSDSTLISIPLKGAAALMNHSSSFSCCSLLKVEGWNSRSTHRFASSMPASAAAHQHHSQRGTDRQSSPHGCSSSQRFA